ncbi:MAG: GTPase Era [Myxococcota bacterium]
MSDIPVTPTFSCEDLPPKSFSLDESKPASELDIRAGRCAIVGPPNVGKSTLLNLFLGQRLAIVTTTPGTTRTCLLGVHESRDPRTQIAFVDTPGLHRPKSALGKVLLEEAKQGLLATDCVLLMVEASRSEAKAVELDSEDAKMLRIASDVGCPVILAINKVDHLRQKSLLLPQLQSWSRRYDFAALVPISAKEQFNTDRLLAEIRALLPEGLLYENDFLTDKPTRFFAAELIREALLRHTRAEIPHGIAVHIEEYLDDSDIVEIRAVVVVEKDSHKSIVIGAQGSLLKTVGSEARANIEALIEKKVMLKLWVKVVREWTASPAKARELVGSSQNL